MTVRLRLVLYAVALHALLIALSLLLLSVNRYLFVVAEVMILLSVIASVHLYRAVLKPIRLIAAGAESIKDRDFSIKFVETGQADVDQLIAVFNTMVDRLRAERIAQQEQHYFLRRLVEATPLGIIILDLDGRIDTVNPAAGRLMGTPPASLIGGSVEVIRPHDLGETLSHLRPGTSRTVRLNGVEAFKCTKSHFLDRGFPRHFIVVEELSRDILAAQKQAYDKVIRMMSHEINNSVGAVNSILQSTLGWADQLRPPDAADLREGIRVATERNRSLSRFMTRFADVVRVPPPQCADTDLADLLKSVYRLMSMELNQRRVGWEWNLDPNFPRLSLDAPQIEQVLVNVVRNALEAVDHDGVIEVRTLTVPPRLVIADSGPGPAADIRPHLFTPFFSTKPAGQGIGLTLTREILVNHGCRFGLDSVAPGRTEFWIEFTADHGHQVRTTAE
jgi:nitrogen fixation/metabolism regulation signal transduction histidine kinase